jgi:hypothetical protein
MSGPIISPLEFEIQVAMWRILARQARATGRAVPPRPRRVKSGPKGAPIPDGLLVGTRPQVNYPGVRHTQSQTMQHANTKDAMTRDDTNK